MGIKCRSHAEAQEVFRLQALVVAVFKPGVHYTAVIDYFLRSGAVSTTLIDDAQFYGVHRGAKVGIYRSWYGCYSSLTMNY